MFTILRSKSILTYEFASLTCCVDLNRLYGRDGMKLLFVNVAPFRYQSALNLQSYSLLLVETA